MLESRISIITEKLEKFGNVEVKQLSQELNVSEKTIRSDLTKMEKMGILKRVHGGAVSIINQSEDAYFNKYRTVSLHEKELIARIAFDFARNFGTTGKVFFIDAGTTNYEFAKYFGNMSNTIITNDLLIASKLSCMNIPVHMTGGQISNNVNKYLVGPDAINMVKNHFADICFLGTSSIGIKQGLMTQTNEDAEVKRAMIAQSKMIVCLVDSSKFGKTSFVKFADVKDIDIIITDKASQQQINDLTKIGVKVLVSSIVNE